MLKRTNISLIISFIFAILLIGCTNEDTREVHLKQLTRVDVEVLKVNNSDQEAKMITDEETIDLLRETLSHIKWEPDVQPSMSRKEDVKATLFFKYDENMPERLLQYQIWFNPNNTATIISSNEKEGYGTLDKDHAGILENIFLNK